MEKIIANVKNFIIKIRSSDERTRKKWLYIFTAGAMVIVLAIWLLYARFSFGLFTAPEPAITGQQTGFFAVFKTGLKSTYETIQRRTANTFNFLKNKAQEETIIELTPPAENN